MSSVKITIVLFVYPFVNPKSLGSEAKTLASHTLGGLAFDFARAGGRLCQPAQRASGVFLPPRARSRASHL